jgi:hypothetical protein
MYDYVRRDKRLAPFVKQIKGLPLFIGDDIALWYQSLSNEEWTVDDFPTLAPPYRHIWLDYLITNQDPDKEKTQFPSHFGLYCSWRDPLKVTKPEFNGNSQLEQTYYKFVDKNHSRWVCDITLFQLYEGKVLGPRWGWKQLLDQNGKIHLDEEKETINFFGPLDDNLIEDMAKRAEIENRDVHEIADEVADSCLPFLHTAALTIAFLHTKNIEFQEEELGAWKPRTKAQKRRGEQELPALTYKTLIVKAIKKSIQIARDETGTKGSRSLHFVRGHFHTYTEEKPLFGRKGLTGDYFIPFHSRGNANIGQTVKDYEVRRN